MVVPLKASFFRRISQRETGISRYFSTCQVATCHIVAEAHDTAAAAGVKRLAPLGGSRTNLTATTLQQRLDARRSFSEGHMTR